MEMYSEDNNELLKHVKETLQEERPPEALIYCLFSVIIYYSIMAL